MSNIYPDYYYQDLPLDRFPNLIISQRCLWETLEFIAPEIHQLLSDFTQPKILPEELHFWERPDFEGGFEKVITVAKGLVTATDIAFPLWGIYIARDVILEPTSIIKGPAYIGSRSEVRQGAYIRGNVIIGSRCTVGHNTEIKNAILMDHTEAGHFAYIGDSILGKYVNIGAGVKLANLPFRTFEDKKKTRFPPIHLSIDDKFINTQRSKIGAFLGDGVEIGCNATLAPGTFLGPDVWVYPCTYLSRGFYPSRMILKQQNAINRTPKTEKIQRS